MQLQIFLFQQTLLKHGADQNCLTAVFINTVFLCSSRFNSYKHSLVRFHTYFHFELAKHVPMVTPDSTHIVPIFKVYA